MHRSTLRWLAVIGAVVAGCNTRTDQTAPDQPGPAKAPVTVDSKLDPRAVLALDGPGGSVRIGDTLEQAKKAFPPPQGAHILGATNFAVFSREGWTWATDKPEQAFEVSLKAGKIVGITQTVGEADEQARKRRMEQTVQKVGPPSAAAEGKTIAVNAWDVKPNARFTITMNQGLFGSGPLVMTVIGDQSELKMLNYRVDDVATLVKQMEIGAEAMKKIGEKKGGAQPGKGSAK
jgi:hypothetical protein